MLSLKGKILGAATRYLSLLRQEFGDRLVAVYMARHPAIEVDGYNSIVVLRNLRPDDQEKAVRIAVEACRDLDPEEQIAPLTVEEESLWFELGEHIVSLPRSWELAAGRFISALRQEFGDRLVAVYMARHPAIEVDGYNSIVVLRNLRPDDQEKAVRIAVEACRDLDPEEQIAPLTVEEVDLERYAGEFCKKV